MVRKAEEAAKRDLKGLDQEANVVTIQYGPLIR